MGRGADTGDGSVEVPEAVLGDVSSDLGAETEELHGFMDNRDAALVRDLIGDRDPVEWHEGSGIDDLDAHALPFQLTCRFEGERDSCAEGDDGRVGALAGDTRPPELDGVASLGDR